MICSCDRPFDDPAPSEASYCYPSPLATTFRNEVAANVVTLASSQAGLRHATAQILIQRSHINLHPSTLAPQQVAVQRPQVAPAAIRTQPTPTTCQQLDFGPGHELGQCLHGTTQSQDPRRRQPCISTGPQEAYYAMLEQSSALFRLPSYDAPKGSFFRSNPASKNSDKFPHHPSSVYLPTLFADDGPRPDGFPSQPTIAIDIDNSWRKFLETRRLDFGPGRGLHGTTQLQNPLWTLDVPKPEIISLSKFRRDWVTDSRTTLRHLHPP
ncbi:hypothetical protein BKA70DRAFT_1425903 [Coprinopsis sp. MPI-PUGE-AT-0042]|nr:hypothetical protein BKA70DRAFT_1425903 [Coprinopsis sp. MPI-PUGE-AT-0042]